MRREARNGFMLTPKYTNTGTLWRQFRLEAGERKSSYLREEFRCFKKMPSLMSTTQPLYFSLFRLLQNLSKKTKKILPRLAGYQNKTFLDRLQTNARVPFSWFDLDPEWISDRIIEFRPIMNCMCAICQIVGQPKSPKVLISGSRIIKF